MDFHLVQANIAIAKYDYDDPRFAGFVDNLDRIYDIAESLPGFIWRHETIDDDAEAKQIFGESEMIFNMSVWESKEALQQFVYRGEHASILRQRADWFVLMDQPAFVLWWQPAGTLPTITETKRRLDRLQHSGPSEDAFTFRSFFEAPLVEKVVSV